MPLIVKLNLYWGTASPRVRATSAYTKKHCHGYLFIMRNTGLEEPQAGIKIAGRNINNLRYADDIA